MAEGSSYPSFSALWAYRSFSAAPGWSGQRASQIRDCPRFEGSRVVHLEDPIDNGFESLASRRFVRSKPVKTVCRILGLAEYLRA
jgi:hypothetical protein